MPQSRTLFDLTRRFREALRLLLSAAISRESPEAAPTTTATVTDDTIPECSICLSETGPLQALFIGPCSHCYHYKCVQRLLFESPMFQCPLCRQMSNLTASLSSDQVDHLELGSEDDLNASMGSLKILLGGSGARGASNRIQLSPTAAQGTPSRSPSPAPLKAKGTKFSKRVNTFFQKVSGAKGATNNVPDPKNDLAGTYGSLANIGGSNGSIITPNISPFDKKKSSSQNLYGGGPTTPRKLGIDTNRRQSCEMLADSPQTAKVEGEKKGVFDDEAGFRTLRRNNTSKK
jgi:hypothetical protein